ncbi:MAG: hypothetical protein ACI9MC_000771 [Kiritimatiellia bacterium]|jgi:hypothetical protein
MRLALFTLLMLACGTGSTDATDVETTCEESCKARDLRPCRDACEETCDGDLQCFDVCAHDCQIAYDACVANECS